MTTIPVFEGTLDFAQENLSGPVARYWVIDDHYAPVGAVRCGNRYQCYPAKKCTTTICVTHRSFPEEPLFLCKYTKTF